MAGFCINAMLVAVPMQIQQPIGTGYGLGASATLTGFMLVPAMLIGTTAPLATWIERKLGQRTATIVGPVSIAAAAFSLMASAGNFTMVLIGLLLVGFGCGISITQAMNLVVSGVPPERVAAFSGLNFVVKAVGATSGAQIAASILSTDAAAASDSPSWAAFNAVWLMCAGMCIATLILGLTIKNRRSSTDSSAAGAAGTATPRADQDPTSSRRQSQADTPTTSTITDGLPPSLTGADPGASYLVRTLLRPKAPAPVRIGHKEHPTPRRTRTASTLRKERLAARVLRSAGRRDHAKLRSCSQS